MASALAAEHAAIFGYGPAGARLDAGTVALATAAEAAHRATRDAVALRLTALGEQVPAADPAYTLPFAVTDRASALRLAVTLEERCAAVWRAALPETDGADRALALDALIAGAERATRLRRAAGTIPATVPLPGAPA
jgi:hypothetical protein